MTDLGTRSHRLGSGLFALTVSFLAFLMLHGTSAHAASCPNEAIRASQGSAVLPEGSIHLPGCMALEMVSPAKKFNQYAIKPNLSASGERVVFSSLAALADTPRQGSFIDKYIATRTASGWSTQSTATPPALLLGTQGSALPCGYSADLSRWVLRASTYTQASLGIATPFQGGLGGFLSPLGPALVPAKIFGDPAPLVANSPCEGMSVDASHMIFSIQDGYSYLPGDPVPGPGQRNVYMAYVEQGTPTAVLLQRDKDGDVYGGNCGVIVGSSSGGFNGMSRGSVSSDASRIYLTTRPSQPEGVPCNAAGNPARIMLRLQTPSGPEISQLIANECTRVAPPCSSVGGDDVFLGASQENDKVFFGTARQLASSDEDETLDLYLYEASKPAGERLTQVSAGDASDPTPGSGAKFLGLVDYSGDGSHAYFVAQGVLTTSANAAGKSAEAGKPNLYLYERDASHPSGHTAFIATLSANDEGTWSSSPGEANQAMAVPRLGGDFEDQAVGGDGHILVFLSHEALGGDDTDGGESDIYRYDAESGAIQRVSAAAPDGEDDGPFEAGTTGATDAHVFRGPQNISFGRWVSEDGETVIFNTKEALDPNDTDGETNTYIWHGGAVGVLPARQEASLSMSGEEVVFMDTRQLLAEDGDGAQDVYLLRAGGGFPPPQPPQPCEGEACQGPPGERPGDQGAASGTARAGNPSQAPKCRKGLARRKGRCVKPQHKRHRQHSKAHREQGGQK